jgi:tetratricopeptide (TPR) repeat protein
LSVDKTFAQQQDISIANEYWVKGEREKAYELFKSLAKSNENLPLIHNNYLNVLLTLSKYKEAEDHVEKMIKRDAANLNYRVDLGLTYVKQGDLPKAEKYYRGIIKDNLDDPFKVKIIADHLLSNGLAEYSEIAFKEVRLSSGKENLFALEMANVYRVQGKKDEMVSEYLNYVTQTPSNISYIKNLLQILLTKADELESLERLLLSKVQQSPDSEVFIDLLIWDYQQQKNFYGAFIQSRAYDKRFGKGAPKKTFEIAQIAFNNKDYDNAGRCYSTIIKDFVSSDEYLPSRLGLLRTTEAKVKQRFPVNKDSVKILIGQYQEFTKQFPDINTTFESLINEAKLYAYYLNQFDSAMLRLNRVIANNKASTVLKAKAKLEIGDIYLLRDEPWEATLLYSQVEKSQRESQLGYEAKLRNARLSYFQGDFKLAEAHLDILKQATSREIANDALELTLRIKENLGMDSVGTALILYADVEKLLYQNKIEEALIKIDELKKGQISAKHSLKEKSDSTYTISNYSILDDVYWLEANLKMRKGEFTEAIALLEKILVEYPEDVLADDAYFTQADIYQNQLRNKEKAMEIYREFLTKFPGSVFAAEARKRFRWLRGDFTGQENLN